MKLSYCVFGCLLAGLAGGAAAEPLAYHGESTTFGGNDILRNDVTRMIAVTEAAQGCREIQRIAAQVERVTRPENRWLAQETWRVQACGKTHRYDVLLREDERGETDFSVGFRPE